MKTESRAAHMRLERRELDIVRAKRHVLRELGNECSDLLQQYLNAVHDDAKAWAKFEDRVADFKTAYVSYCDTMHHLDNAIRAQQQHVDGG